MGLFSNGKKNKEKDITEILQYQLNNNSNIRTEVNILSLHTFNSINFKNIDSDVLTLSILF